MREFDHSGLLLAEYQGKLFEKSYDLNCSAEIFLRSFIHSHLATQVDAKQSDKP